MKIQQYVYIDCTFAILAQFPCSHDNACCGRRGVKRLEDIVYRYLSNLCV